MRSSDLGFVVVMLLAGGVAALGLAVFPPGRAAGVYPTITAWAPASLVGLGMLTLFGAAACSGMPGRRDLRDDLRPPRRVAR